MSIFSSKIGWNDSICHGSASRYLPILPECADIRRYVPICADMCRYLPVSAGICRYLADICRHSPVHSAGGGLKIPDIYED